MTCSCQHTLLLSTYFLNEKHNFHFTLKNNFSKVGIWSFLFNKNLFRHAISIFGYLASFPDELGHNDTHTWLKSGFEKDLSSIVLAPETWPAVKACHRVKKDHARSFVERLLDTRMAVSIDDEEAPRRPKGKPLVGGFFSVPHTKGRQRLIFDRRPQNGGGELH